MTSHQPSFGEKQHINPNRPLTMPTALAEHNDYLTFFEMDGRVNPNAQYPFILFPKHQAYLVTNNGFRTIDEVRAFLFGIRKNEWFAVGRVTVQKSGDECIAVESSVMHENAGRIYARYADGAAANAFVRGTKFAENYACKQSMTIVSAAMGLQALVDEWAHDAYSRMMPSLDIGVTGRELVFYLRQRRLIVSHMMLKNALEQLPTLVSDKPYKGEGKLYEVMESMAVTGGDCWSFVHRESEDDEYGC